MEEKNETIKLLVKWRSEITCGQVRVMFLDECHLLWVHSAQPASRCRGKIVPKAANLLRSVELSDQKFRGE